MPEQLIKGACHRIVFAVDGFLMFLKSDRPFLFVLHWRPKKFWQHRPGQPVHSHCVVVRPSQINVRGNCALTKNGKDRWIPLNSSLRQLLEQMRAEQANESPDKTVMRVFECQKSIDRAAKLVGVKRITHHDLRHLFATRCIEAGVDIPTVSRWLGHQDGGALCMKTYGHLRDEHSQREALKVTF